MCTAIELTSPSNNLMNQGNLMSMWGQMSGLSVVLTRETQRRERISPVEAGAPGGGCDGESLTCGQRETEIGKERGSEIERGDSTKLRERQPENLVVSVRIPPKAVPVDLFQSTTFFVHSFALYHTLAPLT